MGCRVVLTGAERQQQQQQQVDLHGSGSLGPKGSENRNCDPSGAKSDFYRLLGRDKKSKQFWTSELWVRTKVSDSLV